MSVTGALSALALACLAVGLTAVGAVHAAGQTLTVNTTADGRQGTGSACGSPAAGGACTLRAAIELADSASGDTIRVPAGTYPLDPDLGTLDVRSATTIKGAGPSATILEGGQATRVLFVESSAAPVAISGLTVRNGMVTDDSGADIASEGALSLTDVVVRGGNAPSGAGGGIASDGPLTLDTVVVSGNHAGDGGGLFLVGSAGTTITRSTISGNTADGALFGIPGLRQVRFPGHGGGISLAATDRPAPSLTIGGSAISGNGAQGPFESESGDFPQGGGIFNFGAVLSLANDTLAGDTATSFETPRHPAVGGGIAQTDRGAPGPVSPPRTNAPRPHLGALVASVLAAERSGATAESSDASTALDFVTVAGNSADAVGGVSSLVGKFTVANSIVAGNAGGNCGNPGAITSTGYNVESGSDCGFRQTGDQSRADPKLDALKVNAPGATATMALLPASPAVDAADPRCDQRADQRGVTRPQGSRCDIGAFEVEQAAPITATPAPPVTGVRGPVDLRGGAAPAIVALMVVVALAALVVSRRRGGAAVRAR